MPTLLEQIREVALGWRDEAQSLEAMLDAMQGTVPVDMPDIGRELLKLKRDVLQGCFDDLAALVEE